MFAVEKGFKNAESEKAGIVWPWASSLDKPNASW